MWSTGWRPAWVGLAAALAVSLVGNAWQASRYPAQEARVERPPLPEEAAAVTLPAEAGPSPYAPPASAPPAPAEYVTVETQELRARLARELERAEAEARVKKLHLQGSRAPVVTFTLAAGLLRAGGSLPRVTVPKDAIVVRLRMELPGDDYYPLYRAALLDANGDEIWAASKLRAEGEPGQTAVVLVLPYRASAPRRLPAEAQRTRFAG